MKDLFGNFDKSAVFSEDRKYRYVLRRSWSSNPAVVFIGLNPSTANETEPDNTIIKVCKIARNNGFGTLYMPNLFAIVSRDPAILDQVSDPVGPLNNHVLKEYAAYCECVVACWGNFKQAVGRSAEVSALIGRKLSHLHINKNGSPKHPLYCRDNSIIIQPTKILYANTEH